jgi:hypothetical protein
MSTKVYSGFSWDATDLPGMMERLRKVQVRLKKACNDRKAGSLANMAVERIDRACMALAHGDALTGDDRVREPLSEAHSEMHERQKKILTSGYRDMDVDFEVRIALWFVPELSRFIGHVLAEDQGVAYRLVRRQTGVADFRYWNNTDQPKGISRKAWTARGAVWAQVSAGQFGTPLVVTVDADYWVDKGLIARRMPTHASRVSRIALNTAYRRWREVTKADGESEENEFDMSGYMRYRREARKEGTQAALVFAEESDRVNRLLPRDARSLLLTYNDALVAALLDTDRGSATIPR